jgi:hypothetical protein
MIHHALPDLHSVGENGAGLRGLDAATVLQPEQDASGQSRKTTARERLKTAYICEISRQGSTHPENLDLTYKEGVAGSTPASPTLKDRTSDYDQRRSQVRVLPCVPLRTLPLRGIADKKERFGTLAGLFLPPSATLALAGIGTVCTSATSRRRMSQ